jgi:hypothetical protein
MISGPAASDQRYKLTLNIGIAQRAACSMHKPGSFGDERPPARMRRAARQANGAIRPRGRASSLIILRRSRMR